MSLPLNQHYIKRDMKILKELNWNEEKKEQNLIAYKFRIDVKEGNVKNTGTFYYTYIIIDLQFKKKLNVIVAKM